MKILITGASGFVGQALQNYLSNKNFIIRTASIRKTDDVNNINFADVDIVIHLAALVHQMTGADTNSYMESNFDLTKALALVKSKFIFISTVKVYGESFPDKILDDNSDCLPEDPYGESKLLAEQCLQEQVPHPINTATLSIAKSA